MPDAYSYEVRERAEELYVVDGLTFEQVAEATGVSVSQLKRWSAESKPPWTEARREYRAALSSIRRNTVLAKAKLIKEVIATMDPQKAYAFSSLISADKAINQAVALAPAGLVSTGEAVEIKTPADAVAALQQAIERKVNMMLAAPGELSFKALQETQKAMELVEKMKSKYVPEKETTKTGGLSDEAAEAIRRQILGLSK